MFNRAKPEKSADGYHSYCRACFSEYVKHRRHILNQNLPLNENPSCASYLGVYISETVLSKIYNSIARTPYGTRGYDFVCGKGLKIDVKSSCRGKNIPGWSFYPNKNHIADFFICLAFDSRENLIPLHVWIIPGPKVNHLTGFSIRDSALGAWKTFERPLGEIPELTSLLKRTGSQKNRDRLMAERAALK
jgi:hypothetical protein